MADNLQSTQGHENEVVNVQGLKASLQKYKTDITDGKVDKVEGKGLSTNDYTTEEKEKLAGIESGAEVNQNAFSNVVVGTTTISADGKTDSLTLVAGSNVTLTPDATNDKITIAATDTTYSSKAAASGGTEVSLCTTGEKYTWGSLRVPKLTIADYTTAGANYTTFASVSSSSTSRYKDCTVLISGAGYYYSNGFTGTWLVEMRSSTAGAVKMDVRCIATPNTSSTVKFGYYTEDNVTYFGIHSTSRRGEFNVTTLLNNSNLFTIAAGTPATAAPTGWTEATTKMSLHDNDFTANNKGTSVDKILVTDANNGFGYSTPSDLASVLGVLRYLGYLAVTNANNMSKGISLVHPSTCTNLPSDASDCYIIDFCNTSNSDDFQFCVSIKFNKLYLRTKLNGTWASWIEI